MLIKLKKKKTSHGHYFPVGTLVTKSCPTLVTPWSVAHPSVHGISQGRILESVVISFSGGSSQPGIKPGSPALQEDSLLTDTPGKPIR